MVHICLESSKEALSDYSGELQVEQSFWGFYKAGLYHRYDLSQCI